MKSVFYPYKMKSSSAKVLSAAFSAERVRPNGEFRNNFKRPIINWGNSARPLWMTRWADQKILNLPEKVAISCNKLLSFQKFSEHQVPCPEWTTSADTARQWGDLIVVRKTITGKQGSGIILVPVGERIPEAPLYTKYFKKKHEYRVHVFEGKIIDFVEKKKRKGTENVNYQVRSYGEWVFCREGVVLPDAVCVAAIKAVQAIGLHFGAVDVGWNVKKQQACVFEVNSAPGMEGETVNKYVAAIQEYLK